MIQFLISIIALGLLTISFDCDAKKFGNRRGLVVTSTLTSCIADTDGDGSVDCKDLFPLDECLNDATPTDEQWLCWDLRRISESQERANETFEESSEYAAEIADRSMAWGVAGTRINKNIHSQSESGSDALEVMEDFVHDGRAHDIITHADDDTEGDEWANQPRKDTDCDGTIDLLDAFPKDPCRQERGDAPEELISCDATLSCMMKTIGRLGR